MKGRAGIDIWVLCADGRHLALPFEAHHVFLEMHFVFVEMHFVFVFLCFFFCGLIRS